MNKIQTPARKSSTIKPPAGDAGAASGGGGGGSLAGSGGAKAARRLGRGLSSLLGTPVKIELEPPATATDTAPPPAIAPGHAAPDALRPAHATRPNRAGAASPSPAAPSREPARPAPAGPEREAGGGGVERVGGVESDDRAEAGRVVMLGVGRIVPNRHQPRRRFEEGALGELAASIRAAGVVQPVLVRRVAGGTPGSLSDNAPAYELVAGERRWRAAKLAGLARLPAVVAELSDEQAAEWALIENVQRTDLSAMETAYAVRELCERFKLTHAQAADKLGLDRTSITNLVRLTDLEPEVRDLIEQGALTAGHGKVLLAIPPSRGRVTLARRAVDAGWSVRRLGSAISILAQSHKRSAEDADAEPAADDALALPDDPGAGLARDSLAHAGMRELEKQLGEHLGTKVRIKVRQSGKRGALRIDFYDLDHFDGLMAKMGFVMQ